MLKELILLAKTVRFIRSPYVSLGQVINYYLVIHGFMLYVVSKVHHLQPKIYLSL